LNLASVGSDESIKTITSTVALSGSSLERTSMSPPGCTVAWVLTSEIIAFLLSKLYPPLHDFNAA
jgi:hypothetical protein